MFFFSKLAKKYTPYLYLMRLPQPTAILLLLLPCLWALTAASEGLPALNLLIIFTCGAILTRSAGCIINDLWDRKIDNKVQRTKKRPLADGTIKPYQALLLLLPLAIASLLLALTLNTANWKFVGVAVVLTIIYPASKRFFFFPQLILGLVFSLGVPIAYIEVLGTVPWSGYLLYGLTILWVIMFDLQYALQDLSDDSKLKINSGALWLGKHINAFIYFLQLILCCGFAYWAWLLDLNIFFYVFLLLAILVFCFQAYLLQRKNTQDYWRAFCSNHYFAWIVLIAIIFGTI